MKRLLVTAWMLIVASSSSMATIYHVPGDYRRIQSAMDASSDGDTVLIAPGTYSESFLDPEGKAILITGRDPWDPAIVGSTVIDARGGRTVFYFKSQEDTTTVLTGLTLTRGFGTAGSSPTGGGATCAYQSSPKILRCLIEGNTTTHGGGGIYCDGSSPLIVECDIRKNSSQSDGAGMEADWGSFPTFRRCRFMGNVAEQYGGGGSIVHESSVRFVACHFIENRSEGGGGVYGSFSTLGFSSCQFRENLVLEQSQFVQASGGGLYTYECDVTIDHSTFSGNRVRAAQGFGGGALFQRGEVDLSNCLIFGNRAGYGGGVFCTYMRGALNQNTITENDADFGGGILATNSFLDVINDIVWGNKSFEILYDIGVMNIAYCDVEGGIPGVGNINADPRFQTWRGQPYVLAPGSLCIDAGDPSLDDGINWPPWYLNGPRSDMGAYGGPDNTGWIGF